jgi:hypothetical protein
MRHMSRWWRGEITAAEQPYCAAPAFWDGEKLICWVSDVYKSTTQYGEVRVVNYRDAGRKCSIWCFRKEMFELIERTAGSYTTFLTEKKSTEKGEFANVVGVVIEMITSPAPMKRERVEVRR